MKNQIVEKFISRDAKVGIVGLGYVGLPLVLSYVAEGYQVVGIDIDQAKVDQLNQGKSYIKHISSESILDAVGKGFSATTDFSRAADLDALILCVPTPLNQYREPDISFIVNTMDQLLPYIRQGHVISLESTTYPGTTEEELCPRLESAGFQVGKDVFLVYSPEREDPGNPNFNTRSIPKVYSAFSEAGMDVGKALYASIIDELVPVSSLRAAEMTKLLENIHRAVNIGLVNEMKIVCDKMGIDVHEVIDAAATKPFGFVPYYPGPGLGGHCIPIDPFYLTWKAREFGLHTRFIELAGEVNSSMPNWVVSKVADGLNKNKLAINGASVLILGIAYKKNVDDMRESPAVAIMELLEQKGAKIDYHDPYVSVFPEMREHHFDLRSVDLTTEIIRQYDCVVLTTAHACVDYDLVKQHAKLVIDTRGVYLDKAENIIKA